MKNGIKKAKTREDLNNKAFFELERFFQLIFGALAAPIAILDDTGAIIVVNQAWQKSAMDSNIAVSVYPIGANYLQICDLSSDNTTIVNNSVAQGIRKVIDKHLNEYHWEYKYNQDEKDYWFNVQITRFESNSRICLIVAYENITKYKLAEIKAQKAQEIAEQKASIKAEFLANMSHEIRTPINAVIGITQVLSNTALTAEQRDYVEIARNSGKSLLAIIDNILDFSKIESGKLELEKAPFNLHSCIEDSLDLLSIKAAEKHLNLAYTINDQTPSRLIGDVNRVRQILVNLLSNAVKFTSKGEVIISVTANLVSKNHYRVHFAIKDTGIGIPQDHLEMIFNSFSQVDSSITRRYGGTGLGLAISKHLSEMMGGTIWVESTVGQGSTFHFSIIVKSTQKDAPLFNAEQLMVGKRILIVDEGATNRRILTLYAKSWGMIPCTVSSGLEALDKLCQEAPFDVAILDMQLRNTERIALVAQIHNHDNVKNLPIIILTSIIQRHEIAQRIEVEVAAFLNKPIKPTQFYDVLNNIFRGMAPVKDWQVTTVPLLIDQRMAQRLPLRILLAEDNPVNQKVTLLMLNIMGYKADLAINGLEVLAALEQHKYDVILMDVQMPKMDGLEASHKICEKFPPELRPHIVAMTSNAMWEDRERCLAAGMDYYFSKPLEIEGLQKVLEQCSTTKTSKVIEKPVISVDLEVLKKLDKFQDENNLNSLAEIIELFLHVTAKRLVTLQEALISDNVVVFERTAHTLRGSCLSLGVQQMAVLCAALEHRGSIGSLHGVEMMLDQLEREFSRVRRILEPESKRRRAQTQEANYV